MLFKLCVAAMLVLIMISLGRALFYLAWRIGLSVALFLLLIVAYYSGWIEPLHIVPKSDTSHNQS
jgi:hypothetical protein